MIHLCSLPSKSARQACKVVDRHFLQQARTFHAHAQELVRDRNRQHCVEGVSLAARNQSAHWKRNNAGHLYYECKLLHMELSTLPDDMSLRSVRARMCVYTSVGMNIRRQLSVCTFPGIFGSVVIGHGMGVLF